MNVCLQFGVRGLCVTAWTWTESSSKGGLIISNWENIHHLQTCCLSVCKQYYSSWNNINSETVKLYQPPAKPYCLPFSFTYCTVLVFYFSIVFYWSLHRWLHCNCNIISAFWEKKNKTIPLSPKCLCWRYPQTVRHRLTGMFPAGHSLWYCSTVVSPHSVILWQKDSDVTKLTKGHWSPPSLEEKNHFQRGEKMLA